MLHTLLEWGWAQVEVGVLKEYLHERSKEAAGFAAFMPFQVMILLRKNSLRESM